LSDPTAPREAQARMMARVLTARAADAFGEVDDDGLLNYRGAWLMQADSLEEMNGRAGLVIDRLFDDPGALDARQAEADYLITEMEQRKRNVAILRLSIRLVDAELRKRGAPLSRPTGIVEVSDDADVCQYCVTESADAEFGCCHHKGACWDCAMVMVRAEGARCPNCRAPNPPVLRRGPTV